ncbi:MAG: hypothetical protein AUF67_11670 [Acidobacteria bacterium 13_1_20CM_58_21]|nr:MAG: hypothetical protein AUF67_11670 [Acidobacteria bacterium 13_1_20CM_58_21]
MILWLHLREREALFQEKRLRKFSDLNFCAAKKHRSHPVLMPSLTYRGCGVHPTGIEKRKTLGMHPTRMGSFTIPAQGWRTTELPGCPR